MEQHPIHVTIIGAGLGGLCLAQGLKKNRIAFDVFECDKAPNSRPQGYRIRIDKNGQQALLSNMSSEDYIIFRRSCSITPSMARVFTPQMQRNRKWVDAWHHADDSPYNADLNANRLTMREILLHGLDNHVFFDHKFHRYEIRHDQKVRVFFSNGTMIDTDILIAADGVNSGIVKQWLPKAQVVESGAYCIYGKTNLSSVSGGRESVLSKGTSVVFGNGISAIADSIVFEQSVFHENPNLTRVDDYLYWALIGRKDAFGFNDERTVDFDVERKLAFIRHATSCWHPDFQELFEKSTPQHLAIMPVKTSKTLSFWNSSQITGLGDAIHTMSPAGGVGANTALKDAELLTQKLILVEQGLINIHQAITDYETEMRAYSEQAIRDSIEAAERLYGTVDDPDETGYL
jgi:salicylate hydroxylase